MPKPNSPSLIKSCQYKLIDYHTKNRKNHERFGRFWFIAEHHKLLCDKNGFYKFIVYKNGKPVKQFEYPAKQLNFSGFGHKKAVSWPTIEKMVV